jgi:beta-galactosidase
MKKNIYLFLILFTVIELNAQRQTVNINQNWKFGSSTELTVMNSSFNDSGWESINLPHTWNNLDGQDGGNNYYRGVKWYRKQLTIPTEWSGKKVFIRFGSANMKTVVYVNGNSVGSHVGGYGAFIFDITNYVHFNQINTIAVQVDNSGSIDCPPLSADYTFFGGITRDVEILITNKTFISPLDYASPGVYLTPYNISLQKAQLNSKSLIANHNNVDKTVQVLTILKNAAFLTVDSVSTDLIVSANSIKEMSQELVVNNPVLWNGMKNSYLYKVIVRTIVDGIQTDEVMQPVGFRQFTVDKNNGFYLNGNKYPLHGVAMHEERKDKGRAVSDDDRKQDMEIVHEMGCTFLRLAHYQHGQYTYNYCDSTGMVLWTEVPLINYIHTTADFTDNTKSQLNELIKQNYNHPSIFFWGMFNEINLVSGPDPAPLVGELNTLAHSLDSTRLTTAASANDDKPANWIPDLICFNKYFGWYGGSYTDFGAWADGMHTNHPGSRIGVSEYGAGSSVNFHQENPTAPDTYGPNHPEEYQNQFHEVHWQSMLQRPFLWTTAIWVAFDFASDGRNEGDAAGINDKGMVTHDRSVKKDAYYYYKANWTKEPFAYISERRFTGRPNSLNDVKVYSNCDSVSLWVNNKFYSYLTLTNHIFKWSNVQLLLNTNKIKIKGYFKGTEYPDSCFWNYNPLGLDTIMSGQIQINFQPVTAKTPSGYLADNGAVFGDRCNGYTYGWNEDITLDARERTSTSNQFFNTFIHMQKNSISKYWEIALANGTYLVSIGCGDPDYTDSYHSIEAENKLILSGIHTSTRMIESTDTVMVTDSRLTISPSVTSVNAKINLITITKLTGLTGIADPVKKTDNIKIFQNKVSECLNVQFGDNYFQYATVTISNLIGQSVFRSSVVSEKMSFPTGHLLKGVYLVLIAKNDGRSFTKKIRLD